MQSISNRISVQLETKVVTTVAKVKRDNAKIATNVAMVKTDKAKISTNAVMVKNRTEKSLMVNAKMETKVVLIQFPTAVKVRLQDKVANTLHRIQTSILISRDSFLRNYKTMAVSNNSHRNPSLRVVHNNNSRTNPKASNNSSKMEAKAVSNNSHPST